MRILHIISNLHGGAGKAAVRLHEALLNIGVNSHIICLNLDTHHVDRVRKISYRMSYFRRALQKIGLFSSIEKQQIIKKRNADNRYDFFSFCQSSIDILQLEEYINADIINLHWVAGLLDFPSFFNNNKKPVVWSLSDMNPFTGGCHYSNGCNSYKDNCHSCPQLKNTISEENANKNLSLKMNSLRKMNFKMTIVTAAHWMNDNSKSSSLFQNLEHKIIPHPSDEIIYKPKDARWCRSEFNIPEEKIVLLFSSGSLRSIRKGFSILSKAMKILDNPNIHVLIIGEKDVTIDLPEESYTITGYIQNEKRLSFAYNASNVVIIPSIEDNLPLTLIDSMMCGVPTISFKVGGMRDYIINEINGLICKSNSAESLAETINQFIMTYPKYNKLSIREMAMKKFNKTNHAKNYVRLYKTLI